MLSSPQEGLGSERRFICPDEKGGKPSETGISKLKENSGLEEPRMIACHPSGRRENSDKLNGIMSTALRINLNMK